MSVIPFPKRPDPLLNAQMDLLILTDKILAEATRIHKKSIELIVNTLVLQNQLIKNIKLPEA